MSFDVVKANDLLPGETAWEVMEQNQNCGEKPVRLVISSEAIRTVTSLALARPKPFMEFWRISSNKILKVSWCPDLCVLSVLYLAEGEEEKDVTKVFFVEPLVGKRIVQHYKKIKPAAVKLSPGRKSKATKKYTSFPVEDTTEYSLTSSFRLKHCLSQEKFWRALLFVNYSTCKEIFFGIGPTSIRIINPATSEADLVVTLMCVAELKFYTHLGSPTLIFKYFPDPSNTSKSKKLRFHILPVTGQEMIRWYEYCTNFGDIGDSLSSLPVLKPEDLESPQKPTSNLSSSDKENIPISKTEDKIVRMKSSQNVIAPQNQLANKPFKPIDENNQVERKKKSVATKPMENNPLQQNQQSKQISKSKSVRTIPTRV